MRYRVPYFHHRAVFDSLPGYSALHILGDDAVVNRDVAGRPDQVTLFQSPQRKFGSGRFCGSR
jgi:hypothetical protein